MSMTVKKHWCQAILNFDIAGKYWNEPIELKIDEIKEILKESIRTGDI